jgi:hypothetical protein
MSIPGLLLLIIEVASQFFILFFATLIWLPRSIFQQENGFHFLVVLNTLWRSTGASNGDNNYIIL